MSAPIHDHFEDPLKYAPPWARHAEAAGVGPPQDEARALDAPPAPARLPSAPSTVPRADEREPDGPPEPEFEGDIAIRRLHRRRSLHPEAVREPMRDRPRVTARTIARLAGVLLVAAAAAFALVMLTFPPGVPSTSPVTRSASLAPEASLPKSDRDPLPDAVPARADAMPDATPAPSAGAPAAPVASTVPPGATRDASPAQPAPLDPEEIAVLLRRGQDFFANGDLASARLMFRRAAEAGDARAALSLGATYDPSVLGKLPVLGAAPDRGQAQTWYRRAVELGSAEAARRMEQLSGTGQ